MEQCNSLIKEIRCPIHEYETMNLIDLTGISSTNRLCLICVQQNKVPYEQYLTISEILGQNKSKIFNTYPPLLSKSTKELIKTYCDQRMLKADIDSFFSKLREDIEAAIQQAENQAKQDFIKNEDSQQNLMKKLSEIVEIDKLKKILAEGSENLKTFLQEKWKNAALNEKKIIDLFEQSSPLINLQKNRDEINCQIQSLQNLNLFDHQIITKNINSKLIKSTYDTSPNSTVVNTNSNSLFQFILQFQQFYSNKNVK